MLDNVWDRERCLTFFRLNGCRGAVPECRSPSLFFDNAPDLTPWMRACRPFDACDDLNCKFSTACMACFPRISRERKAAV